MVLPAGKYRLVGRVSEADFPEQRLSGARVEVTTGVEVPLNTLTDGSGTYRLYGVSGETGLRVTRDGYQPAARTVVVANHQSYNIELPLLQPRANVAGTYTLTIAAASHCGVGLGEGNVPEEARIRSYTARVQQDGPNGSGLELMLSGPALSAESYFSGRLNPAGVEFELKGWEGEGIIEPLPPSRVLEIGGMALAAVSPTRLAGTLTGTFQVFEGSYGGARIARCSSTSHQFVLSR